jgi:hypothetical protein
MFPAKNCTSLGISTMHALLMEAVSNGLETGVARLYKCEIDGFV